MKSLILAAITAVVLAQPALAGGPALSGLPSDIFSGNWPQATVSGGPLFTTVAFKDGTFAVATTKLTDISALYGGKLADAGVNGPPLDWLCYDEMGQRVWFLSGQSGNADMIVLEKLSAAAPDAGCATSTADFTILPTSNLPGLGATLTDLNGRFGPGTPDADGRVAFAYQATVDGSVEVQNAFYVVTNGLVTAVAFSQFNTTP